MTFNIIKRQALIVWLYSTKQIKELRKHGYIHYYSRKMKYAIIYVDKKDAKRVQEIIDNYFFVRQVDISYRDDIDMTFKNAITPSDESKYTNLVDEDMDESTLIESISESIRKKKMING